MASNTAKHWLGVIWKGNVSVLLVFIVCMVTVDMNGEYPFLSSGASLLLSLAVFGSGIAMNSFLTVFDQKRRLFSGMLLVLFILAALPVFV